MGKNRPNWGKGVRESVRQSQSNRCAWCGEELNQPYEVHHDYRGHKWHEIDKMLESDDMDALGLSGNAKLRNQIRESTRSAQRSTREH